MRWMIRVFVAIWVAAAGVVIAMDSSNSISGSEDGVHLDSRLVSAAIGVVFAASVYGLLDAWLERKRARRRDEISVVVSELLFPLWCQISTHINDKSASETLGVHAWLVPSWYARLSQPAVRDFIPSVIRRRLWTPPLWRAAQFRLKHADIATGIAWKRGKGAIGMCWEEVSTFYRGMADIWGPNEMTYAQWESMDTDKKIGLDFQEYRRIRRKYGQVLAVPIFRPRGRGAPQFLGCVTIDLAPPFDGVNLNSADQRSHVMATTSNIERGIDRML